MEAVHFYMANMKVELCKLRRTFAYRLMLFSGVILPLLFFIVYFIKYKNLIPKPGVNPWNKFMLDQIQNTIPLLIPMFIVLITSLIIQIEHKATGLKYVFTQPIPKWSVYFGKLSIVFLAIAATYLYFYLAIIVFGYLLGVLRPELNFMDFQPEYWKFLKILGMSFLVSFGIIGIQFWLSFRFKNFIIPLTIGMTMLIVGLIASNAPEAVYFPYSYNILYIAVGEELPKIFGVYSIVWYSGLFFVFSSVFGYLDIKRRNVK